MEERRAASLCLRRNSRARMRYSFQSNIEITRTQYRSSRLRFRHIEDGGSRPTCAWLPALAQPEERLKSVQTARRSGDLPAPRWRLKKKGGGATKKKNHRLNTNL